MWEYIVIVFLVLASGYWIIRPLLSPEQLQDALTLDLNERLNQITLKKEGAYATIKELEFDLSMGKLSKEDFETMKKQYTFDALEYMEEIDQLRASEKSSSPMTEEKIEKNNKNDISVLPKAQATEKASVFCTQCGEKAENQDPFCANCGAELRKT
jgi:formylmethanofuran dehydrogenase subunit E